MPRELDRSHQRAASAPGSVGVYGRQVYGIRVMESFSTLSDETRDVHDTTDEPSEKSPGGSKLDPAAPLTRKNLRALNEANGDESETRQDRVGRGFCDRLAECFSVFRSGSAAKRPPRCKDVVVHEKRLIAMDRVQDWVDALPYSRDKRVQRGS